MKNKMMIVLAMLATPAMAQITLKEKMEDQLLHIISQVDLGAQVGVVKASGVSQSFVAVFDAKGQLINVRAWRPHRRDVFNETGRDIGKLWVPYSISVAADGTCRFTIAPIGWHNTDLDAKLNGNVVNNRFHAQNWYKKLEFLSFTIDDRFTYSNLKTQTLDYFNFELTGPKALNASRTTFLGILFDLAYSVEMTSYVTPDGKVHALGIDLDSNGNATYDGGIMNGQGATRVGVGVEFSRVARSGAQFRISSVVYEKSGSDGIYIDPAIAASNAQLTNVYNAAQNQYNIDNSNYLASVSAYNTAHAATNPNWVNLTPQQYATLTNTVVPAAPNAPTLAYNDFQAHRYTFGLHNEMEVKKRINARAINQRAITVGLKGEYNPMFADGIFDTNTGAMLLNLKPYLRTGFKLTLTLNW